MKSKISIIVPVFNESICIVSCLEKLQKFRDKGHEVIVVDGGSHDNTRDKARSLADIIIQHQKGRARQMNAGAGLATGNLFLFLHADTVPPANADELIAGCFRFHPDFWGCFNVQLSGTHWLFRVIEYFMNHRTRLSGILTGDHGIFVTRKFFETVGGYEEIDLMEDISMSNRLKKLAQPVCLGARVITSSRRWEENGILWTVIKMWGLRLAYALGVNPANLVTQYD